VSAPRLLAREPEIVEHNLDRIAWRWAERTMPPPETTASEQQDRRLALLALPAASILFWTPMLLIGHALDPLWISLPALATVAAIAGGVWWVLRLTPREIQRYLTIDRVGIRVDHRRVRWSEVQDVAVRDGALTVTPRTGRAIILGHPLRPSHINAFVAPMLALLRARR